MRPIKCYIENILSEKEVSTDIKLLIPDAGLRRRMSWVIKTAVSTAMECGGGIEGIKQVDAIITATGWGCLTDSEKFLRNMIANRELLLNPTPFIQSTFNTVGGQIGILTLNHCYNITFVNRNHSFEDAIQDAFLRITDGESRLALVGAYDEQTESQHRIMERMGIYRRSKDGEGSVFAKLTCTLHEGCKAELVRIVFPAKTLSADECLSKYASSDKSVLLCNDYEADGLYPTVSAKTLQKAVGMLSPEIPEVVVYNSGWNKCTSVMVVRHV